MRVPRMQTWVRAVSRRGPPPNWMDQTWLSVPRAKLELNLFFQNTWIRVLLQIFADWWRDITMEDLENQKNFRPSPSSVSIHDFFPKLALTPIKWLFFGVSCGSSFSALVRARAKNLSLICVASRSIAWNHHVSTGGKMTSRDGNIKRPGLAWTEGNVSFPFKESILSICETSIQVKLSWVQLIPPVRPYLPHCN